MYSKVYFTVLCMDILHCCVDTGSVEFCSMSWGAGNRVYHLPKDMEAHYSTAQCTLQGNVEHCTVLYSAVLYTIPSHRVGYFLPDCNDL